MRARNVFTHSLNRNIFRIANALQVIIGRPEFDAAGEDTEEVFAGKLREGERKNKPKGKGKKRKRSDGENFHRQMPRWILGQQLIHAVKSALTACMVIRNVLLHLIHLISLITKQACSARRRCVEQNFRKKLCSHESCHIMLDEILAATEGRILSPLPPIMPIRLASFIMGCLTLSRVVKDDHIDSNQAAALIRVNDD